MMVSGSAILRPPWFARFQSPAVRCRTIPDRLVVAAGPPLIRCLSAPRQYTITRKDGSHSPILAEVECGHCVAIGRPSFPAPSIVRPQGFAEPGRDRAAETRNGAA